MKRFDERGDLGRRRALDLVSSTEVRVSITSIIHLARTDLESGSGVGMEGVEEID